MNYEIKVQAEPESHILETVSRRKFMRPVYMISGGITRFAKAHPDKDFRLMVKEAFDYALADSPA